MAAASCPSPSFPNQVLRRAKEFIEMGLGNGMLVGAVVASAWSAAATAVQPRQITLPLTRFYGGGLTILAYNDLDNTPKNGSAAVLVHQAASNKAIKVSCQLLQESLWDPDTASFADGLNNTLNYQIYQGVFPKTQLFWVASSSNTTDACRAIDVSGKVSDVDCAEELPALCSQSAPVSTQQTNDVPTGFEVDQPVGDQVYTGFRDHFAWKFRGVRFAAQPKRFDYSTMYWPNETTPIPALKAGADCLQPIGEVKSGSSEDCLFMNIWTPYLPPMAPSPAAKPKLKPVMFYIYGGGFTSGSGKNPNTDGTMLASRGDVVSIQINYRVSTVGWLAWDDGVHNGNYGLGDIIVALEWVQKHIADLGGDPKKVTIFGESAGGMLTRALLASPKAKGLFYAAIIQSGPSGLSGNQHKSAAYYNDVDVEYKGTTQRILSLTGCANATDKLACMREYNATEMINLPTIANSLLKDNNYLVTETLMLNNTSGYTSDVVLMTGTNRDELGVDVQPLGPNPNITDIFAHHLPGGVGNLERLVNSPAFAPANISDPAQILNETIRVSTDGLYTCLEQSTAYSAAKHGSFAAVYSFQFNRSYSPPGYSQPHCNAPKTAERPNGDPDMEYFKCHAGEQMIVFGTVRRDGLPDRDGLDVPFIQLVMDYWSSFAHTRDPNPDRDWLAARGYWNTISQIEAVGPWLVENKERPLATRLLQWNGRQEGQVQTQQCEALGLPLDYFETR